MKISILFLLLFFTVNLYSQVLIDQPKKQPDLIITSKLDTVDADYLVESGIFRGSVVKREYKVEYAAHEPHNGLWFEQIVEVLNDKKEPVKKVLGYREVVYITGSVPNIRHWNLVPNNN